jgi:hypothetical protein
MSISAFLILSGQQSDICKNSGSGITYAFWAGQKSILFAIETDFGRQKMMSGYAHEHNLYAALQYVSAACVAGMAKALEDSCKSSKIVATAT